MTFQIGNEISPSPNGQVQDADGVYGVVLIAPSVTPYGHINPSFRVFTMDADSKKLLGYEQYYLNLTLANGNLKLATVSYKEPSLKITADASFSFLYSP